MSQDQTTCPPCDFGPLARNHYFTGKLLVERDFRDEQRYFIDKIRLHNARLHGWGVVCGLKVVPHGTATCRTRYVCVEPGTAVDCCGHDIHLREAECIDLQAIPALKALIDKQDTAAHDLRICIRYRECPVENIPVLYDECACDEVRCAPNRVLESYGFDVTVDMPPAAAAAPPAKCGDLWSETLDGCPSCESENCVVLATVKGWKVGDLIDATRIDNTTDRPLLPSVHTVKDVIDCILGQGVGGAPGKDGKDGINGKDGLNGKDGKNGADGKDGLNGKDGVNGKDGANGKDGKDGTDGVNGKDGANGKDGKDGKDGAPGPGLEQGLTRIVALSWRHNTTGLDLLDITDATGKLLGRGIVVAFSDGIVWDSIHHPHVFQVLLRSDLFVTASTSPFDCRCALPGPMVAVDATLDASGKVVTKAVAQAAPDVAPPGGATKAVALLVDAKAVQVLRSARGGDIFVKLRGDFVVDSKSKRAIDAEFVRAELPTGDRPQGSAFGIQGGTFESWFTLKQG